MVDAVAKVCADFREFYPGGVIPRLELAFIFRRLGIDEAVLDLMPCAKGAKDGGIQCEDFARWMLLGEGKPSSKVSTASTTGSVSSGAYESPRFAASPRERFDLVVLGGGPCGLKAAEDAAARGKSVAIIEPAVVLTGAPTGAHSKCLREAVLDGAKTWAQVQEVLARTTRSAQHQASRTLRAFQIAWLRGRGSIVDENTVQVTTDGSVAGWPVKADAIIIATGSKANRFPPVDFGLPGVYDSDTIWQLDRIPKRLVVQGAGIVSIEYALIFAKLGSHVVVIDAFPAFLPMIDSSLQEAVRRTLAENNIEVIMGLPFKKVRAEPGSTPEFPALRIDAGDRTFGCDVLLSACGRFANSQNLGLENLEPKGLKINPRGKLIEVDENGYTGVAKVYAVGDVATGSMGLATMGQNQAIRAVRALFSGAKISKDAAVKPSVIWTIPELAWAGMTEEQAKAQGVNYGVSNVGFKQTIKGCVTDEDGFLKLIFDRDNGKVLGVHLLGENSCELVNYGAEAVNRGSTIFTMLRFVFPAVTYHTLYSRAAAECKLRLHGAKNLEAATAWKRIYGMVQKSLEESGSPMKVSEALKKAFKFYDTEGHGFLTKAQLQTALESLGMQPDADDAQEMIFEATDGKSGQQLDYETFIAVLVQNCDSFKREELEEEAKEQMPPTPAGDTAAAGRALKKVRHGTMFLGHAMAALAKTGGYDAVVLGAGPAGMQAALEAGARGKRVVLIDPNPVVSGAPTGSHSKCMREAVIDGARTWAEVKDVLSRAMDNVRYVAARSLHTFHVTCMKGYGSLVDEHTVSFKGVNGEQKTLKTDAIIIATGSKANRFPPTDFSLHGVYDSDTITQIDRIPDKLVVQGAGIVSIEYALIFAKLGSEVVVIDAFTGFLPMLDSSLQETIKEELDGHNVEVIMGTPFKSVQAGPDSTPESPQLIIDIGGRVFECDMLLSACGRSGNTQGLGLDALAEKGLKVNPRGKLIEVDQNGYTGVARVYAVGDCATGSMMLATMGQQMAVLAARALFSTSGKMGTEKAVQYKPCAVWTMPEVAWVGLTEEQAKNNGIDYSIAKVEFTQTLRGCVTNEDGYLKLIFDRKSGRVLGVHLFGENSCELVNFGAELVNGGLSVFQVLHFVFPAVTYHQLYHNAAAEAKLRFKGAKDLAGAAAWWSLQSHLRRHLEDLGATKTVGEVLLTTFKRLDEDNSGFLTQAELREAVRSLGLNTSEDSIRAMVLEATGDMTCNEVDYQTIMKMVTQTESPEKRSKSKRLFF